jgi:CheY-like chemotaxis protein/signal transduction histidine kinase
MFGKRIVRAAKTLITHPSYAQVLVVAIAFALMVVLSSYFMGNIVRQQLVHSAELALDSLETSIKADLMEPRTILGNLSETVCGMIRHGYGVEEVHSYLNETANYLFESNVLLSGFAGLYGYFDAFGGVLLDGLNRLPPENYEATERPWYRDAVAAGGDIVFIHPHDDIFTSVPIISYARGIFDSEGNLHGVIVLDVQFERIREYIVNANFGTLGFGILLNEQFEIISNIDPELHGVKFQDINDDTARLTSELKMGHDISEFRMKDYLGIPSITFVRKLENGWYIAIITPEGEYFKQVRDMRLTLILLGTILAVILSAILIRVIAEKQKSDAKVKEAEELEKNANILRKILNNLDALIYITNPQTGEIIFINDSLKKYHNIEGDCAGQVCYKVLQKGMNGRCDFCPCNQLDKEPGKIIEWIEYRPSTKCYYRNTACYITWPGGAIVHLRYSVDITELYNAKEQAVMANRVKSDFLARMSHEIRSPMNVILGITEMQLEKEGLPQDTVEALDKVHNSGYLLLNIINDILDLSKIESGKMELTPVNYDFASMVNDTVQLNIMRFDTKPILFFLKVDENVPATLFGDDLRIKQILNNILSNAFKYTESGEVVVAVSAEVSGPDKPVTLVFTVSDTGYGMTQDQIERLFEDYSRFSVEANREIEGTGLGMSIAKHLIDMMKGEISVKSEKGKGSVFTLRIPQGYVDSTVLGKDGINYLQQLYIGKKAKPRRMPQLTREYMPYGKVLVVDDMEPNLYVASGLLAPYGLSIDSTTNGLEAIEKIKSGMVFDIIFMDHYMPGMDGIETTKKIRSLGYTRPIVALTANALTGQAQIFLANGFDGFIPKPIDIRQLNATLNKFIRDRYPVETVEAARQLKSRLEQKANPGLPDLSRIKALVVDDFLPNLNVAAGMLRKYKMQVDCALSGQEAINRIKSREPEYDIVFMDHMMPEMDGMEATRQIRSLGTKYASAVPIVAVTAVVPNEAAEKEKMFLNNGFQAVLIKPLSTAKLEVFLKEWMGDILKDDKVTTNKKENDMVIEIPGVVPERVMELYDGDMEIFLPVLRSYLSVIPATLDKLSNVSEKTLPDYVVSVHGVKSTSDSIGAEEARKMALELEMLAKAGDLAGVLAKNGALIQYVKVLLGNIQKWLDKLDGK